MIANIGTYVYMHGCLYMYIDHHNNNKHHHQLIFSNYFVACSICKSFLGFRFKMVKIYKRKLLTLSHFSIYKTLNQTFEAMVSPSTCTDVPGISLSSLHQYSSGIKVQMQ
jgi:hypothetical protein